jgi:hypothetical protein
MKNPEREKFHDIKQTSRISIQSVLRLDEAREIVA